MRSGLHRSSRFATVATIAVMPWLAPAAVAENVDATNPHEKLNQIEKQMGQDKINVQVLTESTTALTREQLELKQRLIQAAATAQARERDLNVVEQRVAGLETQEAGLMRELDGQRDKLASLLAILQRMGSEPPPALIVRPDDATAAARSAMLLSTIVPKAQEKAAKLGKDLYDLRELRKKAAEERLRVAAAAAALNKDRNVLGELLEQRRNKVAENEEALKATQSRIGALAEQAGDLRALIVSLNEDASRPAIRGSSSVVTTQIASAGTVRNAPLDGLKGKLTLPANGELATRFGEDDGAGGHLAGIRLKTRSLTMVTSPCDGKIMFAGSFRGYGQMLIIAANGGYHVLLAGLAKIDGVVGQVVLAGEPVGRMGPSRGQGTAGADERLYIEFRHKGVPVDPAPWFAGLKDKVSG